MASFDTLIFWSSAGSEPATIIWEVKIQHDNNRRKTRKDL